MSKKMVNFRYDSEDWARIIKYARNNDKTASEIITTYLDSLLGKDSGKDVILTAGSNDSVKTLHKDIEECKDNIESFKIQFTNNQNEILSKLQDRINQLEQNQNSQLSDKVDKLALELKQKDNIIKGLQDEINYIRDGVENNKLASLSLVELKQVAKDNHVKFNSKISKQDLVKLLIDNEVVC